jgi:hypothetical protein
MYNLNLIKMKRFSIYLLTLMVFAFGCKKEDDSDTKSDQKAILSFKITNVTPEIAGIIADSTKTITINDLTSTSVTSLIPTITLSKGATISPASGIAQDFTNPVVYTVTAEDGSKVSYTVTVNQSSSDPEKLSGTMSSNKTLKDIGNGIDYIIDGTFSIDGNALLTIEPGVKIAFTSVDGWIIVGENAGLKMVGTVDKPIIFTGPINNQNKGAWGGICYYSSRADNLMEYVTIENAGSNENSGSLYIETGAKLSIKNSTITRSASNGLWVLGSLAAFSNNTISNCDKAPVRLETINQVQLLDATSSFLNNSESYIQVDHGFFDNIDLKINKLSIPYYFADGISVEKTLTIAAGTQLLFGNDTWLDADNLGKISAIGTSNDQIYFSHIKGNTGYWRGIYISSNTNSTLQYCVIQHGGSGTDSQNLYIGSSATVTLSNCTIEKSSGYGIQVGNGSSVTATNIDFSDCNKGNIYNYDEDVISSSF